MATLKDFIVNRGLVVNTQATVNGVDVLANDWATLQTAYANDAATLLSAQANDYTTYTTLNGRINTVQDNVSGLVAGYSANDYATYLAAMSNDGATLATARANDGATLLTARANDYTTYLAAMSNDGATLATARSNDYVTYLAAMSNDGATLASAQANDGVTLNLALANDGVTLNLALANDGATLSSARANDYSTYLAAVSNDGVTLGLAYANDVTTLNAARANDYATYLAAIANDNVTLGLAYANDVTTLNTALANDYATYLAAAANDGVTIGLARANDYATYLTAASNDGATLLTARSNDYATYLAAMSNDLATLNTARGNDHATLLSARANDYTTYTTLANEYQANDYTTYTTLLSGYRANDYATWSGLNAFVNLKANSSVNIIAGDGLDGGGPLTDNVTLDVDSTVVRTFGDQSISGLKTFSDSVVIAGDLTVEGNTTTIGTTSLLVEDKFIELAANTVGAPAGDVGIYLNRGSEGNSAIYYDQSEGYFALVSTNDPTTNTTVSPTGYSALRVGTLLVSNTTVVTNLNADKLDGQDGSYYLDFTNATNTNLITLDRVLANGSSSTRSATLGGLTVDTNTFHVDSTNNFVGVRTLSPQAPLQVEVYGIATSTLVTTATTANQVLDSFPAAAFRTVKYLIQVHDTANNDYHASEILLTHDGTTVYMTEYAIVYTDISLASLNAEITGGSVRLLVTPTTAQNTIRVVRNALAV